tara:strand:- start:196 stop:642 length:447 start_codon:yes stop_codon:yes gene_type:complete
MKINLEYMKALLDVFIEADTAIIELTELVNSVGSSGSDTVSEEFVFHYSLLIENNMITKSNLMSGKLSEMGISLMYDVESYTYIHSDLYIRLSQAGHDFAKALNNKEVLNKLKDNFKDAPFKVLFDGGQKLLEHYLKKKMDNLLSESN